MTTRTSKKKRIEQKMARQTEESGEKRVFSRVECLMDLEIQEAASGFEDVEATDLSLIGLGFQRSPNREPLSLGQVVSIGMYGFEPLRAKVRWNQGSRVGVQFCGRLHDIVESWVGEVLSAQGVRIKDLFEATRI